MAQRLDYSTRKEISNEVWRVFALLFDRRISFTFSEDNITIVVPLAESVDLDGPIFISGMTEGLNRYFEIKVGERQT